MAEKHAHLQRMSDDKDRMQGLLDAKTVELVEVRRRGADAESAAARAGRQLNGILCSFPGPFFRPIFGVKLLLTIKWAIGEC